MMDIQGTNELKIWTLSVMLVCSDIEQWSPVLQKNAGHNDFIFCTI